MPVLDEDEETGPVVTARASIPIEVDWALSGAHRPVHTLHPALRDLFADEGLAGRVRELWQAEEQLTYKGYLELSAVAQPAGLLFTTDSDAFLDGLEAMAEQAPDQHQFLAEKPSDRAVLVHRLNVLRSDPARRRRYVRVVGEVWSALRERWEREGQPAVEAEMTRRRAQIERSGDWRALVTRELALHEPKPELLDAVATGGQVAIVPSWFARKRLHIDLPGVLLIGVGTADSEDRNRARTDGLARRIKALSDPTRLTILYSLTTRPMTVGELASFMGLSQPTVSNHVKLLREAGLVSSTPDGRSQSLRGDRQELVNLLLEVSDLVGAPLQPGEDAC